MGILNTVGEIAGAVAAVEGAEKLDPDAGLLTKAAAAVAGFKGAEAIEGMLEKKRKTSPNRLRTTRRRRTAATRRRHEHGGRSGRGRAPRAPVGPVLRSRQVGHAVDR